jgi:hypothetical protein
MVGTFFSVEALDRTVEESFKPENVTTCEMENSQMKALYELTRLDCCGFSDDEETPAKN